MMSFNLQQQISLSFAYLAYSGEKIETKPLEAKEILQLIHETIPKIHVLKNAIYQPDWRIVWGPAVYTFPLTFLQDNMMFVGQQISQPDNYVVAIRGTNGMAIWDWIEEDFRVWNKVNWVLPEGKQVSGCPQISEATHIGIDTLLNKMMPPAELPGGKTHITDFLTSIAKGGKVKINFTGHSLAGALSPTLALWFKQFQHIHDNWDPAGNATISVTAFAGATPGNADFSTYFNAELGSVCDRIHNTLDIVPHAWEEDTLTTLPSLYTAGDIKMSLSEKLLLGFIERTIKGYKQISTSKAFTWDIQHSWNCKLLKSYMQQALVQHTASYPVVLNVPELNHVISYKACQYTL